MLEIDTPEARREIEAQFGVLPVLKGTAPGFVNKIFEYDRGGGYVRVITTMDGSSLVENFLHAIGENTGGEEILMGLAVIASVEEQGINFTGISDYKLLNPGSREFAERRRIEIVSQAVEDKQALPYTSLDIVYLQDDGVTTYEMELANGEVSSFNAEVRKTVHKNPKKGMPPSLGMSVKPGERLRDIYMCAQRQGREEERDLYWSERMKRTGERFRSGGVIEDELFYRGTRIWIPVDRSGIVINRHYGGLRGVNYDYETQIGKAFQITDAPYNMLVEEGMDRFNISRSERVSVGGRSISWKAEVFEESLLERVKGIMEGEDWYKTNELLPFSLMITETKI